MDTPVTENQFLKNPPKLECKPRELALAQLYLSRRDNPQDLVDAYMWYLVATNRALAARDSITKNVSAGSRSKGDTEGYSLAIEREAAAKSKPKTVLPVPSTQPASFRSL